MALTQRNPNTVYLGGPITRVNDKVAIEAITPGMLLELHDDSGVAKWGVHDAADDPVPLVVALDKLIMNEGIDDAYAAGDLVEAGVLGPGSAFYGIIPSGQDIDVAERLQSNGDGKLKTAGSGDVRFVSLDDSGGAVTADTRIRVEVL
jgi:hypothetical protein